MRSIKRIIALAMVAMMLVCTFAFNTSASEDADYTEAARRLGAIDVMKGDTSGNLMLDQGVTRYQAALFFVQAMTGETSVEKWNAEKQSTVFTDVPEYATAIDYANGIGLIRGRGNGIYGYNDPITYQDMLVLAVRALGYETDKMAYPSGYLVAARKLELIDGLASGIKNTDPLTRGETAQIIWNMLGTEIAVNDPLTDKILYPGEESSSDGILGGTVKRTTFLKEAGFSQGVIESTIVEYNKAELSSEISTVKLENGIEIAAADLDITARTNPSTFLGLPITLYVDCEARDFENLYDLIEEEREANIIFHEIPEFTNVVNVGNQTNIKVTEKTNGEIRVTLGETTFGDSKYDIEVYLLDAEDGWYLADESEFIDNFMYEDGEYTGANSYGEVDYATIVDEEAEVYRLLVLYKPYTFGQYFTRTIRYQASVSDESFITIGKYNGGEATFENIDKKDSYFVETLLGNSTVIDVDTISVSKRDGEAARDARLSGESVRSGDFMFYYYNELDNVLEVGYNCGSLKSGTLTSKNDKAQTVKISGTTYTYGFDGAYTASALESALPVYDGAKIMSDYIGVLESGTENVQYVAVNDRVLYIQTPLNLTNHRVKHNYVFVSTKEDIMADLLKMEVEDYREELTDEGIYVSENGNMTVAVLNTTNGKWDLAEVAQFEYGNYRSSNGHYHDGYVHKDAEWANVVDLADHIEKAAVFGTTYKDYDKFDIAVRTLLTDGNIPGGMFAVRSKTGNVYNLSVLFHPDDYGMVNNGKITDGLYFSDNAAKTNNIWATRTANEKARVGLTDSTVIVVVDTYGNVGVRVGVQEEKDSIVLSGVTDSVPAYCYSASNKLIVFRLPIDNTSYNPATKVFKADGTTPFDVYEWEDASEAGADETYYIGLNDAGVSYEVADDGSCELTVTGLFNLRTRRVVSAIKLTVDDLDETNIDDVTLRGEVLYMDKYGELNVVEKSINDALVEAVNMGIKTTSAKVEEVDLSGVVFKDDCSITVDEFDLDAEKAIAEIVVNVMTLDATDIDFEKFDVSTIALNKEFTEEDEDNEWGATSVEYAKNVDYYAYEIGALNTVEKITEPVAGTLDQYIIDTAGETLYIAKNGEDYFENAAEAVVTLYAAGNFDKEDGVLTLYVVKLLENN